MSKTNQRNRIIAYIKEFGSITTYDAFNDLGCVCLPKRISELKDEGYLFDIKVETAKNRYGEPVNYNRYSLAEGVN